MSQEQIARRVGVDRSAVSRVMRGRESEAGIAREVVEKIRRTAAELGYMPNGSAQAIRSGRFGAVSVVLSTDYGRSYLPSRLLDGIHDALAECDLHLMVTKVPDQRLSDDSYIPKVLRTLLSDGLIINYTHYFPIHLRDLLESHQLPAVWLNAKHAYDAVYPDNFAAAKLATQRMIRQGHRRIVYVDTDWTAAEMPTCHFGVAERRDGYLAAMREAGLEPREIRPELVHGGIDIATGYQWLTGPNRPTGVLCYWTTCCAKVLRAAWNFGLRVPGDLVIYSCGADMMHHLIPQANFMIEPEYEMGRLAVQMLERKIAEPAGRLPARTVLFKLHERSLP